MRVDALIPEELLDELDADQVEVDEAPAPICAEVEAAVKEWRQLRAEGVPAGSSNRRMAELRRLLLGAGRWRECLEIDTPRIASDTESADRQDATPKVRI